MAHHNACKALARTPPVRRSGHLYQGRFKSFPVENDGHLLTVVRYAERNPLRAGMVQRAEHWPHSSLRRRIGLTQEGPELAPLPVERSRDWLAWVNEPQTEKELAELRTSVTRGRPFGSEDWQTQTAKHLGLEFTFRKRGRKKAE